MSNEKEKHEEIQTNLDELPLVHHYAGVVDERVEGQLQPLELL